MENLFTNSFFKKNKYFQKELNLSDEYLQRIRDKILNWQNYCENFTKGVDKETSDESEFVKLVFNEILGYTGKSEKYDEYTINHKFSIPGAGQKDNTSGQADSSLGYFTKENQVAQVLIEFKDPNSSDLEKSSNRKDRLSPVNQCWNYLNTYNEASWGIVTNFNEIRLYHKESGKNRCARFFFVVPEEFKGKHFPLSDENELRKFMIILSEQNLISVAGKSFTEEILGRQGTEEKQIQNEFYKKYKSLRQEIFQKLLEKNSEYDNVESDNRKNKDELLRLVQKFLDRIIFCWFCEDSRNHLLPTNILHNIICEQLDDKYYKKFLSTIWERVKELFNVINKGGEYGELVIENGYNGGLFEVDLELNELKIPNSIFEEIRNISRDYDFGDEAELSVNILGHIFEQSISDLEEMKASFEGKEVGKSKSKRKKEGVYYTPEYITNYIVENTVGKWLKDRYEEVKKKHSRDKVNKQKRILADYKNNYLAKIKVLDPACGSGAFLIAAFNYLWNEHKRVHNELRQLEKVAQLFDPHEVDKSILQNNLYGVDINSESVEITKLSLWLKTANKGKKLSNLDDNIKCGNSLIDDPEIAGDKAFNWDDEFPFKFDVVIGNPPYVKARDNEKIIERQFIEKKFTTPYKMWDLYIPFVELGLSILKESGNFSMIIPDTIGKADYTTTLVKMILEDFSLYQIDFFPESYIFENVGIRNKIIFVKNRKTKSKSRRIRHSKEISNVKNLGSIEGRGAFILESSKISFDFENVVKLGYICYVSYGLRLNSDKHDKEYKFRKIDLISDTKTDKNNRCYTEGKYLERYTIKDEKFVEWGTDRCPNRLVRPTFPELYTHEKLLLSRQKRIATIDKESHICDNTIIVGVPYDELKDVGNSNIRKYFTNIGKEREKLEKTSKKFDLRYLLAIINSRLIAYFLKFESRGKIDSYPDDWKKIPIKNISLEQQKPLIEKADLMLKLNKEFSDKKTKFLNRVKQNLNIEKISNKLKNFYELSFENFKKEIKKIAKLKFSRSIDEKKFDEYWIEDFEETKKEVLSIKEEINKTDGEIDSMVYELYGLTAEEIGIVEGRERG